MRNIFIVNRFFGFYVLFIQWRYGRFFFIYYHAVTIINQARRCTKKLAYLEGSGNKTRTFAQNLLEGTVQQFGNKLIANAGIHCTVGIGGTWDGIFKGWTEFPHSLYGAASSFTIGKAIKKHCRTVPNIAIIALLATEKNNILGLKISLLHRNRLQICSYRSC